MWLMQIAIAVVIFLLVVAAVAVLAAVCLVLGTGLARVFAVSVWEATLVVIGVSGGLLWAVVAILRIPTLVEVGDDTPPAVLTDLPPFPAMRRSRPRHR